MSALGNLAPPLTEADIAREFAEDRRYLCAECHEVVVEDKLSQEPIGDLAFEVRACEEHAPIVAARELARLRRIEREYDAMKRRLRDMSGGIV